MSQKLLAGLTQISPLSLLFCSPVCLLLFFWHHKPGNAFISSWKCGPTKFFFLKKQKKTEKKQMQQWHRFARYICCKAQGSIKHLVICEEHNSCLLWKKFGQFCLSIFMPLSNGCKNAAMSLKKNHAVLPQWLDCWRHEEGKCYIQTILPHVYLKL